MSTVRSGNQLALLVVDVQAGVMHGCWDPARVVGNVARTVASAREHGVPVIWVQHDDEEMPRGSAAWQLVPDLVPAPGEARVCKQFPSSFEQTDLESHLARLGATHIVLAGAETNWCIRATAYAALERGYDLTLVKDAHTGRSIDLGSGASVEAEGIVNELNTVMTWLRYPGRKSSTATVEKLDFAAGHAAA
jgi:nicotinamidase-related amidase